MLIIVKLMLIGGRDPTLFQASCVKDWSHHVPVELTKGSPVGYSLVNVEQSLVIGTSSKEIPDEDLLQDPVESRFCVEEDGIDRKLRHIQRIL